MSVLLTIVSTFQLIRPGDFDMTQTSYSHCLFHVQFVFHSSLTNWDNTTELHLYLDECILDVVVIVPQVTTIEEWVILFYPILSYTRGII